MKEIPKIKPVAPRWASRIPKGKIARLYEDDAAGMQDEALINDVAFTLLSRCKSMLTVEAARNGLAACPACDAVVEHGAERDTLLACGSCDWTGSWEDYRGSFQKKHLIAPGLIPFCREYVQRLPRAQTLKEKMYWIDWIIHRFHWEGTALPGQPGAVCLIQGRASDVNEFLSNLSAGTHRSGGPGDLGGLWTEAQREQIRKWRRASDRRKVKRTITGEVAPKEV